MAQILLTAEKNDLKKIIEFAKKFNVKIKKISTEEIENMELIKAMGEGREADYVSEGEIMKVVKRQIQKSNMTKKVKKNALDEAIEDVKTGNVTACKDFEDYKKITREILEIANAV